MALCVRVVRHGRVAAGWLAGPLLGLQPHRDALLERVPDHGIETARRRGGQVGPPRERGVEGRPVCGILGQPQHQRLRHVGVRVLEHRGDDLLAAGPGQGLRHRAG